MKKPKIGLVLSSGGARGFAHLGVLKVLRQEGIPVDCVAGSSMGSIIAVLLANGLDLDMCEKLACSLKRKYWLDFTLPKTGFVAGRRVKELIRLLSHGKRLEELEIPTAVVATDLVKGEPVVFTEGPVDQAVRASIAIPGIFEPVKMGDRVLVDGGVMDRLPVSAARSLGADFVIAVDVIPRAPQAQIRNIFDIITQTLIIMEKEITGQKRSTADFIIHPDVGDVQVTSFSRVEECIKRGEEEARALIDKLKEQMDHWQGEKALNEPME